MPKKKPLVFVIVVVVIVARTVVRALLCSCRVCAINHSPTASSCDCVCAQTAPSWKEAPVRWDSGPPPGPPFNLIICLKVPTSYWSHSKVLGLQQTDLGGGTGFRPQQDQIHTRHGRQSLLSPVCRRRGVQTNKQLTGGPSGQQCQPGSLCGWPSCRDASPPSSFHPLGHGPCVSTTS